MTDQNPRPLVMTRLYGLADAGQAVGIQPEDLLRLGAAGHLTLCVLVPANTRAFTIAPRSTAIRDAQSDLDKHLQRTSPSPDDVPALQDNSIGALCLSQAQCWEIFAFGINRAWAFRRAYAFSTTSHFDYADPAELTPLRLPLFNADGTSSAQDHWRFAIYPADTAFVFHADAGFPAPQELLINPGDVRVLGRELGRLYTLLEGSAEEEDPEAVSGSRHAPPPESTGEKPARRRKRTKAEILASGITNPIFIDIEEVMRRTGLGKSTIYDYLNRKHKLYDPTFPTQITIGNRSVGWLASEIEAWTQSRIEKSRTTPPKGRRR